MKRQPLGALLLALAGSCGAPQSGASGPAPVESRTVKKTITPDLQQTLDRCVQTDDPMCSILCAEAFAIRADQHRTSCKYTVTGTEITITGEIGTYPSGSSSSSSSREQGCAGGRRPVGMICAPVDAPSEIAAYLAGTAQLEAASVTAFVRIYRHLVELGAPKALLARVAEAAADEIEHTRLVVGLARAYGASSVAPVIHPEPSMTLLDRAIDNAVEGRVGETVAALHAAFIATNATDPAIRTVFTGIVEDEARHALLARDLHRFYAQHLGRRELRTVDVAYRAAVARALATAPSPAMRELGIPEGPILAEAVHLALAATAVRARVSA